jgi:DNA-binding NtrC family response regulator
MTRPPGTATSAIVLSVGPNDADDVSLERILHRSVRGVTATAEWTLLARPTLHSALSVLREATVPIVVCEAELLWRELLEYISSLADPPLLIVTSRLADERLWAEALSLGAYDVLAKPFDATEVIRILGTAWQHWQDRYEFHAHRTEQRRAATGT